MAISRNIAAAMGTWTAGPSTSIGLVMSWSKANLGDRVLAFVSTLGSNPTFSGPAGWTQITTYKPTTTLATTVYYKDYTVEDPTAVNYTWSTGAVSGRMTLAYVPYSGCDLTLPPLATQNTTLASSRTATAPSVAMTDGDWYVGFTAGRENPGTATNISWTPAAGSYEWYDYINPATGTTPQLATNIYDLGGPSGTATVSGSTTADKNLAEVNNWAIRLRAPASAGGWRVGMPIR